MPDVKIPDAKILEKRIDELETRLKKVEEKMAALPDADENALMDILYKKAREVVIKNNKASAIFLQRKLLVDLIRVNNILKRLQADGVIGPDTGTGYREVLIEK